MGTINDDGTYDPERIAVPRDSTVEAELRKENRTPGDGPTYDMAARRVVSERSYKLKPGEHARDGYYVVEKD